MPDAEKSWTVKASVPGNHRCSTCRHIGNLYDLQPKITPATCLLKNEKNIYFLPFYPS